jgi:zinc protease
LGVKKWAAFASAHLLLLWLGFGVPGSARENGNTPSQSSPFVLPIAKRDSLLNGLQLFTLEQQSTGTVAAHLRLNSGGMFDLAGKGGLADLTAGMLLKGGSGLNAKSIADTVEQLGLTVNVRTGWDSTDISVSGPPDSLEPIFDLLGKLLISPAFDQKELDALKATRIAELNQDGQDASVAARSKAQEVVFGSHPFGRPVRGTAATVGLITRQDLIYFHNRFYIANNAVLVVSGDVTAEQVTRLARSKLGAWKKGDRVPPTFRTPEVLAERRVFILDRSDEQPAQAAVAQIGLSRRAADYFAAVIAAEVLGEQVSKLAAIHAGTKIETRLETRLLAGPLMVRITAAPGDLAGDLDLLLETMASMHTSPPASDRVEAAKERLISSMADRLKTTAGAAEVILDIETFGLGKDYVITFADRVNAITPADVQRAAQTYFKPKSVAIVIAGSAGRFEASMKKIGAVAVLKQ